MAACMDACINSVHQVATHKLGCVLALQAVRVHGLCWLDAVCRVGAVCGIHHHAAVVCICAVLLQVLLVARCCFEACC